MLAIEALRAHGEVKVFGSAVGRPIKNKCEVAKDFRFVLAFENDVYPGYVTEKPLEAYACGAIPLWRGLDSSDLLNGGAIINAMDFDSLASFARHVADLNTDLTRLNSTAKEPLLNETPSLLDLEMALRTLTK